MKLEEMKSNGHRSNRNRVGRGPGSGNGKLLVVVKKVKKQEAVEVSV